MASETPNQLSFGVELEFLFYYKIEPPAGSKDKEVFEDPEEEKRLPPAPVFRNSQNINLWVWATDMIKPVLLKVPGVQVIGMDESSLLGDTGTHRHIYLYPESDGWDIKSDTSIDDERERPRGYASLSFEITSPALWAKSESFKHVHRVVTELTKRFRLRVNLSTGLHCHVGAGCKPKRESKGKQPEVNNPTVIEPVTLIPPAPGTQPRKVPVSEPRRHSRRVIQRAAALTWAADGFLCHIHPPERAINKFSAPARVYSALAQGVEQGHIKNSLGVISLLVDIPMIANPAPFRLDGLLPAKDLPSHIIQVPRQDDKLFPALRPENPGAEEVKRFDTHGQKYGRLELNASADVQVKTVLRGVEYLSECTSRSAVAAMLETSIVSVVTSRLNYNFINYQSCEGEGFEPSSGTAEFREAAGSLSPEWITIWAQICVGIFRFARQASDARFRTVITKLAMAEAAAGGVGSEKYDMVSLLLDLGLVPEAIFLERKLREDPVRFWYPNRFRPEPKAASSSSSN